MNKRKLDKLFGLPAIKHESQFAILLYDNERCNPRPLGVGGADDTDAQEGTQTREVERPVLAEAHVEVRRGRVVPLAAPSDALVRGRVQEYVDSSGAPTSKGSTSAQAQDTPREGTDGTRRDGRWAWR